MAINPHRETIINEIFTELDFGVDRGETLSKIVAEWQISTRTFDRYWKEARSRFQALTEKAQKAKEEVYIQEEKKAAKKAILSKHQRQEILTQIAMGQIPLTKHIVCDGVIQERDTVPNWADRKAAIAELNKMDGDYAPTKKDITSGGEPIKQITGIIVE